MPSQHARFGSTRLHEIVNVLVEDRCDRSRVQPLDPRFEQTTVIKLSEGLTAQLLLPTIHLVSRIHQQLRDEAQQDIFLSFGIPEGRQH